MTRGGKKSNRSPSPVGSPQSDLSKRLGDIVKEIESVSDEIRKSIEEGDEESFSNPSDITGQKKENEKIKNNQMQKEMRNFKEYLEEMLSDIVDMASRVGENEHELWNYFVTSISSLVYMKEVQNHVYEQLKSMKLKKNLTNIKIEIEILLNRITSLLPTVIIDIENKLMTTPNFCSNAFTKMFEAMIQSAKEKYERRIKKERSPTTMTMPPSPTTTTMPPSPSGPMPMPQYAPVPGMM
jgi:hypothetical protein